MLFLLPMIHIHQIKQNSNHKTRKNKNDHSESTVSHLRVGIDAQSEEGLGGPLTVHRHDRIHGAFHLLLGRAIELTRPTVKEDALREGGVDRQIILCCLDEGHRHGNGLLLDEFIGE